MFSFNKNHNIRIYNFYSFIKLNNEAIVAQSARA